MIEDKLLIRKFKQGDKHALRQLYQKYKNDLLKLAVFLTADVVTAEDVVQDVFVSFAQSIAKIRPSGSLKAYLMTSVANRIRNQKRNQQRRRTADCNSLDSIVSDSNRPEQWAVLGEQLQLLRKAMNQLPEDQREVIALYMQGEMTFRQIAKIQNASANTIQGRYRYGLDKLRKLLNSEVKK